MTKIVRNTNLTAVWDWQELLSFSIYGISKATSYFYVKHIETKLWQSTTLCCVGGQSRLEPLLSFFINL